MSVDRSHLPIRTLTLAEEGQDEALRLRTPAERVAMVDVQTH